ncbi:hypothetical protein BC830DRAFT_1168113 [Chytriomyces sp. MP71]|nr:hypothetical protein BC830DRAFT_1168113 [Chytriomyces sp. MP71]
MDPVARTSEPWTAAEAAQAGPSATGTSSDAGYPQSSSDEALLIGTAPSTVHPQPQPTSQPGKQDQQQHAQLGTSESNSARNVHEHAHSRKEQDTLTGFLWGLLSPTSEDGAAFTSPSSTLSAIVSPGLNSSHPVNHQGSDLPERVIPAPPAQEDNHTPDPINIEMVHATQSLLDLHLDFATNPYSRRSSQPTVPPVQSPPQQNIASSLLSFGRSFFSSSNNYAATEPVQHVPLFRDNSTLAQATREQRDSLLDLNTATRPVTLIKPDLPDHAPVILIPAIAALLRPHLSPLQRESTSWRLIYSLDHHGISLNTLYHKCDVYAGPGNPVLLVVRDVDHSVFGSFASEAFRVQHGYFGNGSSFLFKVAKGDSTSSAYKHAHDASSRSANDSAGSESGAAAPLDMEVAVYKATGVNDYLILGQSHYIAMGGGEGHFGLWIDQDLYNGHSGPCHTFNNERLSKKAEFVVQSLELWAFDI